MLDTPQLGVAGRSPVPSVKNQQHPLGRGPADRFRQQSGERHRLVIAVSQREVRRLRADAQCGSQRRHLTSGNKNREYK